MVQDNLLITILTHLFRQFNLSYLCYSYVKEIKNEVTSMKIKIMTLIYIPLVILNSCAHSNSGNLSNSGGSNSLNFSSNSVNTSSFKALSMTIESGQKFNYYLYIPAKVTSNMSLILYLHGGSGKPQNIEGDLSLLTAEDGLPKFVKEGKISPSSYMVFPQLPYGKTGWSNVKNDLKTFLNEVVNDLNCNNQKISITGHSMGGKGTWDIALSYPDIFYKVAPLSGNVTLNDTNLDKLKNKPVWAFVGSEDTIVDPKTSIDFISSLSKINSEAKITILEGYTHFDVVNVYLSDEYNLLSWLVD